MNYKTQYIELLNKIVSQSTDPTSKDEYISEDYFDEDGELTQEAKDIWDWVEIPRYLLELAKELNQKQAKDNQQ